MSPAPEITSVALYSGDFLVTASDGELIFDVYAYVVGLWEVMSSREAVEFVSKFNEPEEAARSLGREVAARGILRGISSDNMTAVIVFFKTV